MITAKERLYDFDQAWTSFQRGLSEADPVSGNRRQFVVTVTPALPEPIRREMAKTLLEVVMAEVERAREAARAELVKAAIDEARETLAELGG